MSALTRWGREVVRALRRSAAEDPKQEPRIPSSPRTQAGIIITPDRAMLNDTVWAARRYLSQSVGQLPARLKRDGIVLNSGHPVDNVLNWRTNPELGPFAFREMMTSWAVMRGNAVAEIETDAVGRVKWLWPLHPDRMEYLRDGSSEQLIYRCWAQDRKSWVDLEPREVFHLRGYGDGAVGLSVIEHAAQTIGWARATELFGANFFGNGMHMGGTAIYKQSVKDEDVLDRTLVRLEEAHRGVNRAHRWFVGDGDMTVTPNPMTPNDAQFVMTMQHQVEAICRWMGVPPHKVYHLLRMTFNNVEQLSIDVVGDSITPWAMRLGDEANFKLFGGNRTNIEVVFDIKGLLRGDFKTRQEGLQIMRRNGVVSADDWAALEDMTLPGGRNGGDEYIIEKNMIRVKDVGKALETTAAAKQTPAPAPTPGTGQDTGQDTGPAEEAVAALNRAAMLLGESVNV